MFFRRFFSLLAIFALLIGAAPVHRDYAEGQVWQYKTRSSDAGSLIKIQKIEPFPDATSATLVYHISVIGLNFGGTKLDGKIEHLPVSRETLDQSVTRLSDSQAEFPDYRGGLAIWREAEGGIFTIPLAQIIDIAEQSFRRQAPGGKIK